MSDPVHPINGSPPGSSVPGILQARTLEWVAISFPNAWMHATLLQLCPTLCDPMESSPPGSPVHRILQARIVELVAISFSNLAARFQIRFLYLILPTKVQYGFNMYHFEIKKNTSQAFSVDNLVHVIDNQKRKILNSNIL